MTCFRDLCWQLLWLWQVLLSEHCASSAPIASAASPSASASTQLPQHCDVGAGGSSFVQLASRGLFTKWLPPPPPTTAEMPWLDSEARRTEDEEVWPSSEAASLKILATRKQVQEIDATSQQPEELGPAAPALSMLELFLEKEQQPNIGLSGPDGSGETAHWFLFYLLYGIFFAMVFMMVPFIGLGSDINCCGDLVGKSIKTGVERLDRSVLGVDVEIGHLVVNPFDGYVDCEHLIIHNPKGYSSQYLLKASKVLVDVDMVQWVQSGMSKISLEKLVFKDIDANYEKKWGTSNMQDVIQHINANEPTTEPPSDAVAAVYEVHKVDVQNVSVNVRASGSIGEYIHLDIEAGNVSYTDFHAEVGLTYVDDIVRELLKSILKTVIANVAGQRGSNLLM